MTKPLLLAFAAGCIVGLVVGIASDDFRARAVRDEVLACKDQPDRVAYYARKPGENHNVETCIRVARYGDPAWIPYMTHPLKGRE